MTTVYGFRPNCNAKTPTTSIPKYSNLWLDVIYSSPMNLDKGLSRFIGLGYILSTLKLLYFGMEGLIIKPAEYRQISTCVTIDVYTIGWKPACEKRGGHGRRSCLKRDSIMVPWCGCEDYHGNNVLVIGRTKQNHCIVLFNTPSVPTQPWVSVFNFNHHFIYENLDNGIPLERDTLLWDSTWYLLWYQLHGTWYLWYLLPGTCDT
jgi:hypothetical protein